MKIHKMMKAKKRSTGAKGHNVRKLLAILFVVILLSLVAPTASASPGWDYQKLITIDHTKVEADLNNFPVLIHLSSDSDLASHAQEDGGDIVFTNAVNTARYDHEIEKFVTSTGELVAWVEVDSLSKDTDTMIYMWYGNPGCADQWKIEETWDEGGSNNYKMVQHLQETCSGTGGTQYDSTSNNNDGTTKGGVTTGAAGKIDGADEFDNTYEYVNCHNRGSLNPAHITLEAWIKPVSVSGSVDKQFFDKRNGGGYNFRHIKKKLTFNLDNKHLLTSGDVLTAGEWHHVAATYDGTNMRVYHNGGLVAGPKDIGSISFYNGVDLYLGAISWSAWATKYSFEGTMDEARISGTARSAALIGTSYNNQVDATPGTGHFIKSLGTQENTGGAAPVPELPTFVLLAVGLVVLAGYVMLRNRKIGNRQ